MKKIKKNRKNARPKLTKSLKMSEMIISFAGDYIQMGNSIEDKQDFLDAACIAWNISLLQEEKRQKVKDLFIRHYEIDNPKNTTFKNKCAFKLV